MAFDSFRDFVNALDAAGELKRSAQPVATELEITELADREMKSPGGGKALLFEQPTIAGVVSCASAGTANAAASAARMLRLIGPITSSSLWFYWVNPRQRSAANLTWTFAPTGTSKAGGAATSTSWPTSTM